MVMYKIDMGGGAQKSFFRKLLKFDMWPQHPGPKPVLGFKPVLGAALDVHVT